MDGTWTAPAPTGFYDGSLDAGSSDIDTGNGCGRRRPFARHRRRWDPCARSPLALAAKRVRLETRHLISGDRDKGTARFLSKGRPDSAKDGANAAFDKPDQRVSARAPSPVPLAGGAKDEPWNLEYQVHSECGQWGPNSGCPYLSTVAVVERCVTSRNVDSLVHAASKVTFSYSPGAS